MTGDMRLGNGVPASVLDGHPRLLPNWLEPHLNLRRLIGSKGCLTPGEDKSVWRLPVAHLADVEDLSVGQCLRESPPRPRFDGQAARAGEASTRKETMTRDATTPSVSSLKVRLKGLELLAPERLGRLKPHAQIRHTARPELIDANPRVMGRVALVHQIRIFKGPQGAAHGGGREAQSFRQISSGGRRLPQEFDSAAPLWIGQGGQDSVESQGRGAHRVSRMESPLAALISARERSWI